MTREQRTAEWIQKQQPLWWFAGIALAALRGSPYVPLHVDVVRTVWEQGRADGSELAAVGRN